MADAVRRYRAACGNPVFGVTRTPEARAVKPRGGKGRKGKAGKAAKPSRPKKAKTGKRVKSGDKSRQRLAPRPLPEGPDSGPDFLCIGAQKGGTRWLYDQLQIHPDFWMPPVKELHYFDRRGRLRRLGESWPAGDKNLKRTNRRQAKLALRPLDQRDIDFLAAYVACPGGAPTSTPMPVSSR